ncbi:hypothetical protein ECG_07814 [Echinococcus granulosus]|nr:hypothetical protein ECG_07814 [Echinococcus granulosus]
MIAFGFVEMKAQNSEVELLRDYSRPSSSQRHVEHLGIRKAMHRMRIQQYWLLKGYLSMPLSTGKLVCFFCNIRQFEYTRLEVVKDFLKYPEPFSDLESGEMTFTTLDDLKLARYGLEANRGKVVSVTHFVKREGNLQWRGPNGEVVAQTHHTAASNETGGGAEPESFTIRGRLLRKHSPSSLSSYSAGCKATSISADRMRFSEIAILTCAPPTAAMGTRPWRWHSYTLEESSRAVLEAVTATANGLQEVIGGADAHMRWFSMSVSHPPRRDAVCAELTEEVYRLINEAYLPQKTAATRSAGYFYQNWLLQR